jgi:DNA-binding IclR family transcriptional regulator
MQKVPAAGQMDAATGSEAKRPVSLDTTAVKAFQVLELLSISDAPMGVSAIARELGLQNSNVHRLLTTLTALGYVERNADLGRYSLSLKVWEVGSRVVGRNPVKRAAQTFLSSLHRETSEHVYLAVLSGMDILYIDKVDAHYPLRLTPQTGRRFPALFTASGKAMLAYLPNAEQLVQSFLASEPPAEALDLAAVFAEFDTIRSKGYATSISGWHRNINSIAAPIWNETSIPVASIGISGPSERLSPQRLTELAPTVLNAAARTSESLGYNAMDRISESRI